jgi:hypothetical protein
VNWQKAEFWLALILVIYLIGVGVGAATIVVVNFPAETDAGIIFSQSVVEESSEEGGEATEDIAGRPIFVPFGELGSADQGLLLLALLSGVAGSFLHAAQSLSSYVGNRTFKASWFTWYFLRPWIGGLLGFALYAAIRAGLVAGTGAVNPYGVVALGLLGGWFSKTTTDKLQEVFETLFQTKQDEQRKDKLEAKRPIITGINPSPIPRNAPEITIRGNNFLSGAIVQINDDELPAKFISATELEVSFGESYQRPEVGTEVSVRVRNIEVEGFEPLSEEYKVKFGDIA